MNSLQKLLDFISKLEERKIYYRLARNRNDALMVDIAVPGERWEVEFFANGEVEVEIFATSAHIEGEEALLRLFKNYTD